jgi:hypothetical protein
MGRNKIYTKRWEGKRRPDIWFSRNENESRRDKSKKKLVFNLVEITVPWREVNEFRRADKIVFNAKDITDDSLIRARNRKVDKYKEIEKKRGQMFRILPRENQE